MDGGTYVIDTYHTTTAMTYYMCNCTNTDNMDDSSCKFQSYT